MKKKRLINKKLWRRIINAIDPAQKQAEEDMYNFLCSFNEPLA